MRVFRKQRKSTRARTRGSFKKLAFACLHAVQAFEIIRGMLLLLDPLMTAKDSEIRRTREALPVAEAGRGTHAVGRQWGARLCRLDGVASGFALNTKPKQKSKPRDTRISFLSYSKKVPVLFQCMSSHQFCH